MEIVVDVESDGPCPGLYSMVSFGAVSVQDRTKTFYGQTAPISDTYIDEALAVSGHSREEHKAFLEPRTTMRAFDVWLDNLRGFSNKRLTFISDNPAFDWQFINYYLHAYVGRNLFGFSARRIGDFYAGKKNNWKDHTTWKKYRKTKHTHHPVDDAKGNAEALEIIRNL